MKKLLIGLVGGHKQDRDRIADTLIADGHLHLAAWNDHQGFGEDGRVQRLERVLKGIELSGADGMIIGNVFTALEAERIRRAGGQLWHVMGGHPSAQVAILPGEPLVTAAHQRARDHWSRPLEALSALCLKVGA